MQTISLTPAEKIAKLLRCAAGPRGVSTGLYMREAAELLRVGRLVRREVFTTGGNRDTRLFLAEARA